MGFMSRKILPACGNMCVCCPALRPSSRRPVKRYKKLLAEIFPKNLDGTPNERKIMKLCEYAAKNPLRIPKIAKFLEQRSYKELRSEHINFVKIITEAYSKLLYICKEQMAYFAISLLNVIIELLDNKQRDSVQILGCQTLTKFICSQADSTYAHNIECLVRKVCVLAYRQGEEQKSLLQAASLQCLSAMIWFMTEYSYIFTDFDEIIHAILENYQADDHIDIDNERSDSHHNWVDEVVRSEARAGVTLGKDVNLSTTSLRPHSVPRDSAMLTREERESPEVWSQICVRKLAEMAKESTTMRCVLDPMLAYFDTGKHWASRHGLALFVLSDMTYSEKSSGNEQLILSAIIRHLDHKNVVHDPKTKSDIVQIATILVQHLRSQAVVAEIGAVSDLCRHLRKSLQTSVESAGPEESNWNDSLQNSIEDCLLEIVKGIGDARPLFDMMAITLEKMPVIAVVARATIGSLLILAHIISLTSIRSHSQSVHNRPRNGIRIVAQCQETYSEMELVRLTFDACGKNLRAVFPEELLLQLLKAMMHPDVETRIVAHQIFSVTLVQNPNHPRHESEYLYETKKWQYRTTSVFASATALLEKLRREKGCLNADKHANDSHEEIKEKSMGDEEWKHGWPRKSSPYLYKLSCSIIDRIAAFNRSMEAETNIMVLTEDQTAQLLSAFWIQVNQADNLPSNIEAISHSFSLTLLFSRIKNSNHSNTVRFFQLPLSLRIASLDPNGMLSPSCQRSLFTLATGMLAFAGKSYHISELTNSLFCISSDIDPYLRVGDDLQIYVKSQSDLNVFGSDIDQQAATLILADLRKTVGDSDQHLFDIIVQELSRITDLEKDVLAKQLTETFTPEDVPLFGSMTTVDWVSIQALAVSEESLSFDEECSRSSTIDGDVISESPATDIHKFIPRMPASPALPDVINVGQLLESALHVAGQVAGTSVSTSPLPYGAMASQCESLGMGTRKKLSSWLVGGHDLIPGNPASAYPTGEQLAIRTVNAYGCEQQALIPVEPRPALRLPPASPFDNFLKALYY